MEKQINLVRHGDLVFKRIKTLPKKLSKLKFKGSFSLQKGDSTGHSHDLKGKTIKLYQDVNINFVIEVKGKATLTHPEHKTLTLPEGIWSMYHEQEFDVFANEKRIVVD